LALIFSSKTAKRCLWALSYFLYSNAEYGLRCQEVYLFIFIFTYHKIIFALTAIRSRREVFSDDISIATTFTEAMDANQGTKSVMKRFIK